MKKAIDPVVERQREDRRYIEDYINWVRWPICPIKRSRDYALHSAYIFIDQETAKALKVGKVRIRHGNIFMMAVSDPVEELTWEEFFEQGWTVD